MEHHFPGGRFRFPVLSPGAIDSISYQTNSKNSDGIEKPAKSDPQARLQRLLDITQKILAEKTIEGFMGRVVEVACEVTQARIGVAGNYGDDKNFIVSALWNGRSVSLLDSQSIHQVERGGVYLDLLTQTPVLRLTHEELIAHPSWWGLPQDHLPLRGLLGVRLTGETEEDSGLIMVSDKTAGDFTAQDERMLVQLAALASLGLRHIYARKEAESRAAEAEEGQRILKALMEHIPEGVTIVDADMQIQYISRYWVEKTGKAVAELSLGPWELFCLDGRTPIPFVERPLCRAMQQRVVVTNEECFFRQPNGQLISLLCNAAPIFDGEGRISGGIISWHDIEPLKTVQQEREWLLVENQRQRKFLEKSLAEREVLIQELQREQLRVQAMAEAARQQAANWNAVFNSLTDAVIIYDSPGRIASVNPAALRICGIEDLAGFDFDWLRGRMSIWDAQGRRIEDLADFPSSRALRGELVVNERFTFINVKGQEVIVLVSVAPLYKDGQIVQAVAIWRDVSKLETLTAQLEVERARFRALIEAAPEGIVETDAEARLVFSNPAAEQLYARSVPYHQAFQSHEVFQLCYLDSTPYDPRDLPLTRAALDGQISRNVEMKIRWPDGQERALLVNTAPILDARGTRTGAVEVFQDISEIKAIQESLENYTQNLERMVAERTAELSLSEMRFRAVFEKARLGIVLTDLDGRRILKCNSAFQQLVGRSGEMIETMDLFELIHPEDRLGNPKGLLALLLTHPYHYTEERRYVHQAGEIRWTHTTLSLVQGTEVQAPFLLHLVEDITERREIQAALIQAEELTVAGKMAASLAHEINNPLQTVIGCLGLLEETLVDQPDAQRYLKVAGDELLRASRIVRHLRDLNRKAMPHEKDNVDVNRVVEQVLLVIQKHCAEQGIKVLWKPMKAAVPIQAVPDQLYQVFLNLVINAQEAMPQGGKLKVSSQWIKESREVCLVVQDTGTGIPDEMKERIFSPFFTTKSEGTGLGLFVSYNIVKEHGGRIEVESFPGKGTTFRVWLPAGEGGA